MKTKIPTVLFLGCITICAALAQKVEPTSSADAAKGKVERSCGSLGMPMAIVSNDGHTLIGPGPINGELKNLTSLGSTNQLLAVYNRSLMASEDGGCTWTAVDHSFGGNITAGRPGEAYIWSGGGRCLDTGDPTRVILHYQSSSERKISQVFNPFLCLSTLVVDASNPSHLRAAGKYPVSSRGALRIPPPEPVPELPKGWEKFENFDKRAIADSTDGGKTWQVIARYPIHDIPSDIFICPKNPDHILLSSSFKEGSVSFDGGKTWRESNTEFSSVVISPVNDKVVWTTSIDPYEREANPNRTESRQTNNGEGTQTTSLKTRYWRLFLSHDGGITFSNVLSRPIDDFIAPFFPSSLTAVPGTAEKVYFATTDRLYTYDSKTGVLSWTGAIEKNFEGLYFIRGILPMPVDNGQIFLALSVSGNRQTNSNSDLQIDSNSNLSRAVNVSVGVSNSSTAAVPPRNDEQSKLPAQVPPAFEFHYMRHNGQMPMTTIDIKNGMIEYEYREYMTSRPVKSNRKISGKEMQALYRIFIDNRFDLIRNDPPVEQANDTSNERISITLGPGSRTQIVFDPIVAPLSGDSLKRFEAIREALLNAVDFKAN